MKNIFKYIGVGLLIVMGLLIAIGNFREIFLEKEYKNHSKTLEEMVAELNSHLPLRDTLGFDFFELDSVLLKDRSVVWVAKLDTTSLYPKKESEIFPESMNGLILPYGDRSGIHDVDTILSKEMMKICHRCNLLHYFLIAKKKRSDLFFEEIMKRKYSQIWCCKSPFSDRQIEDIMTYEEQKQIDDYCSKYPERALKDFVKGYANRQNMLLTLASNNSDVSISLTVDDNAFIYHYTLTQPYSANGNKPISNLREERSDLYKALEEDVNSLPIFFSAKDICKKTNKGLMFRFTDWNKTDSLDIYMYNNH